MPCATDSTPFSLHNFYALFTILPRLFFAHALTLRPSVTSLKTWLGSSIQWLDENFVCLSVCLSRCWSLSRSPFCFTAHLRNPSTKLTLTPRCWNNHRFKWVKSTTSRFEKRHRKSMSHERSFPFLGSEGYEPATVWPGGCSLDCKLVLFILRFALLQQRASMPSRPEAGARLVMHLFFHLISLSLSLSTSLFPQPIIMGLVRG